MTRGSIRFWRGLCAALDGVRGLLRRKGRGSAAFLSSWHRWRLLSEHHEGFLLDGVWRALSRKASFQSVLVVGGVGKGKTTGLCIPNLFHLRQASLVVIDTSGELFEQTSGALAAQGRGIEVLDLMDPGQGMGYNPFARCTTLLERHRACAALVQAASLNASDPFWDDGATKVLRVLSSALYAQDPAQCHPGNLRSLLAHFDVFSAAPGTSVLDRYMAETTRHAPALWEDYRTLVNGNPNTVLSFVSTADTALTALASPEIARLTAQTTFDFQSLRKRPTVLYVKVNEQDVGFYRFILNLFFTDLFGALREHIPQGDELDVYCLLDEFGQLKLPEFDTVIATARKYRVGAMIFLQSLAQLEDRYGRAKARTIRDALQTEVYFGGIDLDLAKELERRLGRERIALEQQGQRVHREENLMNEDAIIKIPDNTLMVFHSNMSGFLQRFTPFYRRKALRQATQVPPIPMAEQPRVVPTIAPDLERIRALSDHRGRDCARGAHRQAKTADRARLDDIAVVL
ncbi:MAG: type IV secretory system conjugative DNA transfer family protein [Paracoccaceae bacterium]